MPRTGLPTGYDRYRSFANVYRSVLPNDLIEARLYTMINFLSKELMYTEILSVKIQTVGRIKSVLCI